MPLVTVRVNRPGNRLIYINGTYTEAAGNSSTDSFTVPSGGCICETLTSERKVDFRKRFRVRRTDKKVIIELDRIDPAQAIGE